MVSIRVFQTPGMSSNLIGRSKKDFMIKRNRIKNSTFSLCGKSNYRWSLCVVNRYSTTNKRCISWIQHCTSVSGKNQSFYSSADQNIAVVV